MSFQNEIQSLKQKEKRSGIDDYYDDIPEIANQIKDLIRFNARRLKENEKLKHEQVIFCPFYTVTDSSEKESKLFKKITYYSKLSPVDVDKMFGFREMFKNELMKDGIGVSEYKFFFLHSTEIRYIVGERGLFWGPMFSSAQTIDLEPGKDYEVKTVGYDSWYKQNGNTIKTNKKSSPVLGLVVSYIEK